MKTMSKFLMASVIALLILGPAASVFAVEENPSSVPHVAQEDVETVRVGMIPLMIFAPLFVADARGYFADEGIELEFQTSAGGSEPLAPLARDELDVVFGGTGAGFFNYAARNIETTGDPNFRLVTVAHIESPPVTTSLVVSTDRFESGDITSVSDLSGGRVAINAAGAGTEYWLFRALEQGGLSMDDIELVAVSFGDVPAALNSEAEDRIDAAMLGEPITSAAEAQGLITRLAEEFLEDYQGTFVYMSNSFLADKRDVAVAFVRALLRGARDLQDPDAWTEDDIVTALTENTFGFSGDLLAAYAFPYFDPNGTVSVENIAQMQDYFIKRGTLSYDDPLDIERLLDTSVVEDALTDLGEYED